MTLYSETQGRITFKNMSDFIVKHKVMLQVGIRKTLQ
jgi:hypothetical protein